MSWLDGLKYRMRAFLRPGALERERAAEARFHLSLDAMQRQSTATDPRAAELAAKRAFGNPIEYRQALRDHGLRSRLDQVGRDLRHATRTLRRAPTYAS